MQDDLTKHGITLDEYISGRSREQLDVAANAEDATEFHLAGRRYVTVVDLRVTQQLLELPEARSANSSIAFARDVKMDELKRSNVILLGARASNPWINLFWEDLDFVIDRNFVTGDATILNRRPRNGEPSTYHYSPHEPARVYFCSIAFEPVTQSSGAYLLLQGTSMVGVQMCATTLLDDARWQQVLSTVEPGGPQRGFEVLMRSGGAENGTAPVKSFRFTAIDIAVESKIFGIIYLRSQRGITEDSEPDCSVIGRKDGIRSNPLILPSE